MARLILLTDFAEEYAKRLLKGIVAYTKEHKPWTVCKMPLTYREAHGIEGVLEWALEWRADAIIGQFYNSDKIHLFKENNILALAQDFKSRFKEIPNITGAHRLAGEMGAEYFIRRGFEHFAFYGFKNVVWSEERCEGFHATLEKHEMAETFFEYQNQELRDMWHCDSELILDWLKQLPKPIAIMACDDNQAHHLSEMCDQHAIKIPEEISLLGVDNDESICQLSAPPLSSLSQAVERGGWEAAALIDRLIINPNAPWEDIVVQPTHIITRESTDIYATTDIHISTILKYIHQNIDKKLSIAMLTKLIPLSRRLLENRFKKVTGTPIYEYIMNLRIKKIAKKLIETNTPIMDIGVEMGIVDYKNFSRQFKKVRSCTPSEYRQRHSLLSRKN